MRNRTGIFAFLTGAPIGCLGGLIGLGGAEFRLPVLLGLFKKSAKSAVALNLAVSLTTIISSLIFRIPNINISSLTMLLYIIGALIFGSMTGAYIGTYLSHKVTESALKKVILTLLVFIGLLLIVEGFHPLTSGVLRNQVTFFNLFIGILFGLGIGSISSLLGVAGGELIIPTLVLFYGLDIKIAGTASLLISLPTILIGIYRHSRKNAYVASDINNLVIPMGIGSILGSFIGTALISFVDSSILKLILGGILIFSAIKIFFERKTTI